jgi:hypothetical protein
MYKNFNLTEEERKQIMEMHMSHGYKQPINEIEKYIPGIDSPEEEDELSAEFGYDDDEDEKDPFSSIKNDDFYDEKLKDVRLNRKPKRADIGHTAIDIEPDPERYKFPSGFDRNQTNYDMEYFTRRDDRTPYEIARDLHVDYRETLERKYTRFVGKYNAMEKKYNILLNNPRADKNETEEMEEMLDYMGKRVDKIGDLLRHHKTNYKISQGENPKLLEPGFDFNTRV